MGHVSLTSTVLGSVETELDGHRARDPRAELVPGHRAVHQGRYREAVEKCRHPSDGGRGVGTSEGALRDTVLDDLAKHRAPAFVHALQHGAHRGLGDVYKRQTPFHARLGALNTQGLYTHWQGHLSALRYTHAPKHEYLSLIHI